MKTRWMKRAAVLALSMLLLATPALALEGGGTVAGTNGTGLNLRASATTASEVLELLPEGTFLLVEETLDGWYKVAHDGKVGYVSSQFLSFAETLDGSYDFAAATSGSSVNLRAGASTASGVVKCLYNAGSAVTVLGVSGDWLHVRDAAGAEGFIRGDLLRYTGEKETKEEAKAPAPAPAASTLGGQLVQTALQYKGYRYVWGGMSPSVGFDCSGFVNYIYNLYGYKLERVAQSIYNSNGVLITDRGALQPGDILCFGWSPYSIGHVGLYIGDGQFIHASNSTTGVIVTNLSDGYYTARFMGAKRVLS